VNTVEPPPKHYFPLDRAGGTLTDRTITWEPVTQPRDAQLYAVRLGYLVSAPTSPFLEGYSIGGPESHKLWEIVCPASVTSVVLPEIPEEVYGGELLVNPAPNLDDPDAPQRYGPDTLEAEFNAYLMGDGKVFDWYEGFELEDVNRHSLAVSQDSYPFRMPTGEREE
jgi:hypothetical protein